MKAKFKGVSRRVLSTLLAMVLLLSTMLVGVVNVSAFDQGANAKIYFDNSAAQWSSVYLVIGKSDYSSVYPMSKISNTNLYYLNTTSWSGASYISFICTPSAWGSGAWGPSNLANSTYYTATESYAFNTNNTYYIKPTDKQTKNCEPNISYISSGYSALNSNQNLKTQLGSTETNTPIANLSISTYKLSNNGASASSESSSSTNATVTTGAARSATVTLSYSNVSSGYNFTGWYNSSGTQVGTGTSYSYTATDSEETYYARFAVSTTPVTIPTITASNGGVLDSSSSTVTVSVTNTSAVTNNGAISVTYELYKEGTSTAVETGNTTGSFTVNSEGSYYVKAVPADTATYTDSQSTTVSVTRGYANFNTGDVIYLKPGKWDTAGATFNVELTDPVGSSTAQTLTLTKVSEDTENVVYKFTVPTGHWDNLTFKRIGTDGTTTWNSAKTSSVGLPTGDQNCFAIASNDPWNDNGSWEVYTLPSSSNKITATSTGLGTVQLQKEDGTTITSGSNLDANTKFKVIANPTISGVTPTVTVKDSADNTLTATNGLYTMPYAEVTVTVNFPNASLPAPTIENKTGALTPSVTTAVIEVTNITEYNSIGTVSFELYKDGTKVTNPKYSAGQFTVSEAGTYKVKATTTAAGYNTESAFSNEVTVEKIDPMFTLKGGDAFSGDGILVDQYSHDKVFSTTVTVNTNNWFRLHSGSTNYKPTGSNSINLTNNLDTNYNTETYTGNTGVSFYFGTPGTYTIFVDQSGTTPKVWATQLINPNAITVTQPIDNGTVTVDQADLSSVNEGTKVTVTASPAEGYKVGEIKVTKTGDSTTVVTVTDNGDGTYSFTMPGYAVTVNATFTAKSQYTVNFSSADSNGSVYATVVGGADLSTGDKVYEGTQVQFTASPNSNYAFNKWSGSDTSSTNPLTVTVNSDITLTASFKEDSGTVMSNMYMLYNVDNNNPSAMTNSVSVYKKNGKIYATVPNNVIEINKTIYFGLSSSTNYTDLYWQEKSNISVTSTDTANLSATYQHYGLYNKNYYFGKMTVETEKVTGITVCLGELDENGNVLYPNYVVTPTLDTTAGDTYTVYAMDGTDRDGSSGDLGDTEIISGFKSQTGTSTYYNTYKAATGSLLQVRTTLTATAKTAGEYVKYFIVNGVVQEASDLGNGVYGLDYLIDGTEVDNKGNKTIEVYPIYFNKNIEAAGDYITVYVDATELDGKWGNIVGAYAYYYKNGTNNSDGSYNTGTYPGVPMYLDNNGKYVTKIPKYAYGPDGQKILGFNGDSSKPYPVSGVTFNNFCENTHHNSLTTNNSNLQTYDYDDFVKIAELGTYDTVEFEIKYRTNTSNQKSLLDNATNAPSKSSTTLSPSDISGYGDRNGWEQLTDYDLNVINLIGTPLNSTQASNPALRVISTGNQFTSVGSWSTVWYVFDSNGNYITQGNPSDFLPRPDGSAQTSQYSLISGNETYNSAPVLITYESEMNAKTSTDTGNSGTRVDGRWYYATSQGVSYTIDVATQYRDSADSTTWTTANETHVLYGKATIDGVTSKTFTERNIPAELVASPALTGYAFTEWVIVDDSGKEVKKLPLTTASGTITANDPIHIVARFTKLAQGSLVIRHSKYTGFDPSYSAFGGGADRLISVVVKDKSGNPIDGMTWTDSKSAIDFLLNYNTQGTIEITLSTICHGMNTFVDFYEVLANDKVSVVFPDDTDHRGETGRITCKWTVNVADLFNSDGTQQLVSSLTYMSDVAPVTADAVLNYKYIDRFGIEKTYVKKVKLDDAYLNANGMTVTDDLIYQHAPAIDDLFKDCKWVLADTNQVSKVGVTATIYATQVEKKHNVTYIDADGLETSISGVTHNTHLTVDQNNKYDPQNGTMLVAPANDSEGNPFSYWLVTIKEGDQDKEVAKCYSLKFGLVILDDYTIEPVYGVVTDSLTIGDPKFTREQSTNADGSIVTDVLYADFVVAFMDSKYTQLNTTLPTDEIQYRSGVLVEVAQNAALEVTDGKITNPDAASTITFDSNTTELQRIALTGTNGSYKQGTYGRKVFNQTVDNSAYNNFNRVDVFFTFNNTVSNQKYVMKAYYYVYQVDANGNFIEDSFKMTDGSLYFNLYNIGNSEVSTDKPSV